MINTTIDCDFESSLPMTSDVNVCSSINEDEIYDANENRLVPSLLTYVDPLAQESNDASSSACRRGIGATRMLERQESESTDGGLITEDEPESINNSKTTKREGQRVTFLKLLVLGILVLSATIIAVVVYLYITNNEEKQFITKFHNDANKVLVSIGSSFDRTLGAMNSISVILVSNAHYQGHKWPFVTLPDFALHVSKLIPLTDGIFLSVVPIVTPSEKRKWEQYALQNDHWVNESLALQEVWDGYYGNITYDWARSDTIYSSFGVIDDNVRYEIHSSNHMALRL